MCRREDKEDKDKERRTKKRRLSFLLVSRYDASNAAAKEREREKERDAGKNFWNESPL